MNPDPPASTTTTTASTTMALAYRPMSERVLSRIGAASGVVSFVVTFVGFGVHGGLPSATTAAAIKSYVSGVTAGQTGLGNYLELLGYLLFLAFATYLYAVARAVGADRFHWLNVLGFAAATTYVAVSALAIAAQQVIVESGKAGVDANTALGFYILDNDAFTMSFEIAAMFAIAVGFVLSTGGFALRAIGGAAILAGAALFITGLVGTISIQSSISQVGLLLFEVWVVAASVFLLIRPARMSRVTESGATHGQGLTAD
jgi:hypothetical protein